MKRALLDALLADRAAKRTVVLATWLGSGRQALIYPSAGSDDTGAPASERPPAVPAPDASDPAPAGPAPELVAAAREAARRDQSGRCEIDGEEVFLRVYSPPLRLVVVGAVHIAQALCPIARLAGFSVTVVDPRAAFATSERFPGVALSSEWPDRALTELAVDHRTAVVTLTHDPKLDEPALAVALSSPAFYVGALGSSRTQAARLGRLRERGFDDATLARIHGPVGLDIGARSAAEIGVAIVAQIIARLRRDAPVGERTA